MLSALFGGKMGLMKNKKGHFDLETLVISVIGVAVAYAILQKHALKQLYKNKLRPESEKNLRFRQ